MMDDLEFMRLVSWLFVAIGTFAVGYLVAGVRRAWHVKPVLDETPVELAESLSGVTDVMRGVSPASTTAAKVEALAEQAYPRDDVERTIAMIREVASGPLAGSELKAQAERDIATLRAKAKPKRKRAAPKKRAKKVGRK